MLILLSPAKAMNFDPVERRWKPVKRRVQPACLPPNSVFRDSHSAGGQECGRTAEYPDWVIDSQALFFIVILSPETASDGHHQRSIGVHGDAAE